MKLRVKAVADPGTVHRVDAPDAWTVSKLQDHLAGSILPGAASLSLNKKDPLGPADATLRALGIRSGDTLWVLSADAALVPVTTRAAAATPATAPAVPAAAAAAPNASTSTAAECVEACAQQPPAQQQQQLSDMEVDASGSETLPAAGGAAEMQEGSPTLPAHLARLLATTQQQLHGVQWLLMAVHAAMLESGFQACPTQLFAEAVAASGSGRDVCLAYALAPPDHTPSAAPAAPAAAAAAARSEAGDAAPAVTEQARCSVRMIQLGPHVMLVAAAQQPASTSGSAGAAGAAAEGSWQLVGTHTLHTDQYIAAGRGSSGASSSGPVAPAAEAAAGAYTDLRGLWVWLKDQLCLPLLAATCSMWGWAAPWGLTTLPSEVLQLVLQQLSAKQLAQACCVSSGLRTAAGADALWDPLYKQEFPGASAVTRMNGPRLGWKWAFAYEWRARQERERERARARLHHPPGPPFPGIMPWGPARPRHPMQPPHIIGGDYDRLPPPLWGTHPSGGNGAPWGGMSSGLMGMPPAGPAGAPGTAPGWIAGGLGAAGLPSGFGGGLRGGRGGGRDWRLP